MKYKISLFKKTTTAQHVKALALICGNKEAFPDVKLPQKRAPETKPRQAYRSDEVKLRKEVIQYLRRKGWKVYRLELSTIGYKGVPDLFCMNKTRNYATFIELKTAIGVLSEDQKEFQFLCWATKINHAVIRSMKELEELLNEKT